MDTLTALRDLAEAGPQLKALRLQRNRTQEEVCAAVGLSRRALQALESGSAPGVRLQTLLKLLRHYQCQLMIAPESPVPTLAELDFERQRSNLKRDTAPPPEPARFRATGRRRRAKG